MRVLPKLILSGLTLALVVSINPRSQSYAQTVYVNGCAAGPGDGDGSQSNPYKTLTQAVARAAPGSTLVVQGGSYPERL